MDPEGERLSRLTAWIVGGLVIVTLTSVSSFAIRLLVAFALVAAGAPPWVVGAAMWIVTGAGPGDRDRRLALVATSRARRGGTGAMMLPALLFDLDGTLTDARPGIVACIRHAVEGLGRTCPDDDVLATFIGPPLRGTFATLLETGEAEAIEAAMALYRDRFSVTGMFENRVYHGVPEMLIEVAARAPAVYVATSKPTVYAERIVRHFDLDRYFVRVYGAELDARLDDKATLVADLLAREKIAAGAAVMIGDRAADVRAAHANGLRAIGVLWGYGSEGELREAGTDVLCAEPRALAALLAE